MELKKYLGETTFYEKKREVERNKVKNWLKTVSAFANGKGGILIFGVSDDDEIIGLEDCKKDSEFISEKIKTLIEPVPNIEIKYLDENNKNLLLVYVFSGNQTPYYYIGNGSRQAFVRIGNESVVTRNHELNNLILKGSNQTYDSLNSNIDFDKASFSKLKASYYQNTRQEFLNSDFESFGLTRNGKLTNAGALLADERLIYQSRIFCTRWNGIDKSSGRMEAFDDIEVDGSILYQLDEVLRFIRVNNRKMWKKTNERRIEMLDYPERAVQETLVNAIIHRDYGIMGSEIHVDIYDDRMEIYSPGGMYDGTFIQERNTDTISSFRRNPVIADLFARMHFMERRGSGLKKIKDDFVNAFNYTEDKAVEFFSDFNGFRVVMKNLNYDFIKNLNNRESTIKAEIKKRKILEVQIQKIMEFFETNDELTRSELEKLLNVKESRARDLLRYLVKNNMLQKIGATRNIRYIKTVGKNQSQKPSEK